MNKQLNSPPFRFLFVGRKNYEGSKMVDVGQRIKEELERQERSVSWLARKLNCTRAAIYRIFAKNSIDTALLTEISLLLRYNFFQELSDDAFGE